jgi:hypothetical protein
MECEFCGSTDVPEGETMCELVEGKVTEPCVACEECICDACRKCERHCSCDDDEDDGSDSDDSDKNSDEESD